MNKGIGTAYRAQFAIGTRRPSRYPCRCTSCGKRRTLNQLPDQYIRERRCSCKRRGQYRVDWYRMAAEWGVKPCRCDEYSFPHAHGRGFCTHNQAVTIDDRKQRYEERRWA